MLKLTYPKGKPICKVTFVLPDSIKADTAFLVGDFNLWSETRTPMKKERGGHFSVTLELEKGREHQFRYLVNGTQWHNDEDANVHIPNPFGGENSVVVT